MCDDKVTLINSINTDDDGVAHPIGNAFNNTVCNSCPNLFINGFNIIIAFGNNDCAIVDVVLLLDADAVVMPNFINNSNANKVSFLGMLI